MNKNNENNCVFCGIAQGRVKAEIVRVGNNFVAIKDAHPAAEGHTLIIPKKHFVTLLDLPNNLGDELLEFTKSIASELLGMKYGNGFNIVMNNLEPAGQVVKHAHIHIIPRNKGDRINVPV